MKALTTLSLVCRSFSVGVLALATPALLHATVWTVSNVPTSPGQYTTLQEAFDAAAAGDTIYVTASATQYVGGYLRKRLTVIGPGFATGSTHARISNILVDSVPSVSGGSGSRIVGIIVSTLYSYHSSYSVIVERCSLATVNLNASGGSLVNGWTIRNNYISSQVYYPGHNTVISNNIFTSNATIAQSMEPSVVIANNLFLGTGTQIAFNSVANAIISNNIFWGTTPVGPNVENCAFSNNITHQTPDNTIPFGSNMGSGNLIGVDPQFVNAPTWGVDHSYDYHLQPGAPGSGAGTDGSDIGIHGGQFPIPNLTGAPRIPVVTQFVIQNGTVAEGGSLNVQVKARKND